MKCEGVGGAIELYEDSITIRRKGALAFITHGLSGDKSIPFKSITAVQFKKAGFFANGYIQFSIAGGLESKKGIWDATSDENTVMFSSDAQESFIKLKTYIEARISAQHEGSATFSPADELAKFAALRDQGIITPDEFNQKKRAILAQ
ncbi:DUF4429 domain-containing protein [Rhizobium ruizarguesonis]|uniref:DUF4429 domain-containing protein n=1 Tax=Rhizobium ruizarguesonis TaxID=2081791 RepID=UPI00102F796C|nr:DUF4429 domain-containing protein [Rhizobium ruizarguesonis]TBC85420.1 DUF4429 domain-containing protein [Rhizobium ruizarguesonis]